jgi:VCBS repeat-containing protein
MAYATPAVVLNVTGQAWIRNPDGTLSMLQAGSRIPAGVEVITGSGASIAVRMEGGMPLLIGGDPQAAIDTDEEGQRRQPSAAPVAMPVAGDAFGATAAPHIAQNRTDAAEQADPLIAGKDNDGGNSFVRVDRILETPGGPLMFAFPGVTHPTADVGMESRLSPVAPSRDDKTPVLTANHVPGTQAEATSVSHHAVPDHDAPGVRSKREAMADNHIPQLTSGTSELTEDLNVDHATGLLTISGQLSITDKDAGQSSFQPDARFDGSTGNGNTPLGELVFNADGSYTYSAENANPAVQGLKSGERIAEIYTVTSLDGTATSTITIVIKGSDDTPQMSSGTAELTEDLNVDQATGLLITQGRLTITDLDAGQSSFQPGARFDASTGNGNAPLGKLVFNADGSYTYSVENANPAVQGLKTGERIVEIYTVTSLDGTATGTITIAIKGSNDVPVVTSDTVKLTEDLNVDQATGLLIAKGQLTITEPDAGQSSFQPGAHFDGSTGNGNAPVGELVFNPDGSYTYSVENANPAVQGLKSGERIVEIYTVTSLDGTATGTITIVIKGSDDTPQLSSGTAELTEDMNVDQSTGLLTTSGLLSITDLDAGQNSFQPGARFDGSTGNGNTPLGELVFNADGSYTYSVENANSTVQGLKTGERIVEIYTVTSLDGTATSTITVVINGSDDVPVVTSDTVKLTEDLNVDQAAGLLTISGQLSIVDLDVGQSSFQPDARFDGSTGNGNAPLGKLVFNTDGSYTYSVENSHPIVQALQAGERIVETYTVTSLDGTATSTITVVINGTNDVPVLSNSAAELTEDLNVDQATGLLTISGQLSITDKDAGQGSFQPGARFDASTGNGNTPLGELLFNADGSYTYSVENANPAIQGLKAGERVVETYTVTCLDGTATSTITVVINGTNDVPVLNGGAAELTEDLNVDQATGLLAISGQLSITDKDAGQGSFQPDAHFDGSTGNGNAPLGKLVFNPDGSYTYSVENANPAVQGLKTGERVVETYTVTSLDGTATGTLAIVINGMNDAAAITALYRPSVLGRGGSNDHGVVVEDEVITTSGKLKVTDLDADEDRFIAQENVASLYGAFSIDENGTWDYRLNNDDPAVQALSTGQTVVERITVSSLDGSARHTVTVTINGTNDAPTSADNAATVSLGQSHTFTTSEFAFGDSHGEHDSLQSVIITRTPDSGTLTLNGQAVTQGQVISTADIAAGKFVYTPGADGQDASFGFQVRDTGGTAHGGRDTSNEYRFAMATNNLLIGDNDGSGDGRQDGSTPLDGGSGNDVIVGDKGGALTTVLGKNYNIALIVDLSGSMNAGLDNDPTPPPGQDKISLLKAALTNLVHTLEKYADGTVNLTLIGFGKEAHTIKSVPGLDASNIQDLIAEIDKTSADHGETNYESAFAMAVAWFKEQGSVDQAGNQYENLTYFLSDGMPGRTNDLSPDLADDERVLIDTLEASKPLKEISAVHTIGVGVPPTSEPFFQLMDNTPERGEQSATAYRQVPIGNTIEVSDSYSTYGERSGPTVLHTESVYLDKGAGLFFKVQPQLHGEDSYTWVLQQKMWNGWEEVHPSHGGYRGSNAGPVRTPPVTAAAEYRLMLEVHDRTPDEHDAAITVSALSRVDLTSVTGPAGETLTVHTATDLQAALNTGLIKIERLEPGSDTINGGDGADVIFGDTPNTDSLSWAGSEAGTHDGQGMDALGDFLTATTGHGPTAGELYDYLSQNRDRLNVHGDTHGKNDTIRGGNGDDFLYGQGGNDYLYGEAGRNFLHGGVGDDTLIAGDEGDVLIGSRDHDLLLGGKASDTFRWEQGDQGTHEAPALDTIRNFSTDGIADGGDVLDLCALLGNPEEGDLMRYLHFTKEGSNTVIQVNTAGTGSNNGFDQKITLENVDLTHNGMVQDAAIIKDLILKGNLLCEGQF